MLSCACLALVLSASTPSRAIEIEFPQEVDLPFARTSPLVPLPLSARWVRGEAEGADGPALHAWVSFGKVVGWHREGAVWKGEWQPPDPAFPGDLQIVVSTVVGGKAVYSAQSAAISAEIELAGRSEPDAEVEIMLRSESFGPVRASHEGRFKLLVVVPPNTDVAVAKSKDRLGNVNKKSVNLFVPKVSTLALACPFGEVVAGSAPLPIALATAVEKAGPVSVKAKLGRVSVVSPGVFSYLPPERFDGPDAIEVKSALGEARCDVALAADRAVTADAALEPAYVLADGVSRVKVVINARDRFGNVARASVRLFEGKDEVSLVPAPEGFVATLVSKVGVDKRELVIEGRAGDARFQAPLVVYQIPDRGVRLEPMARGVRVVPAAEAGAISASDDAGADVPIEVQGGEVRVKPSARPKGHVLFTHVSSGQSVLVPVEAGR